MGDDLTKQAKGRNCTFRAPGCLYLPDTVVLCHVRVAGACGVGLKPPDEIAFWGCDPCHSLFDSRRHLPEFDHDRLEAMAMRAVARTLYTLHEEGFRYERTD